MAILVVPAALLIVATGVGGEGSTLRSGRDTPGAVEVLGAQVVRTRPVPTSSTTVATPGTSFPPTSTTSAPTPVPPPTLEPAGPAVSTTCADALAYLAAHQAPGFDDVCADGSARGHLGFTCFNQAGMCEGLKIIRIACPAPFVYMNEAHNSWVLIGKRTGIDPYGQGHAAEGAECDAHR